MDSARVMFDGEDLARFAEFTGARWDDPSVQPAGIPAGEPTAVLHVDPELSPPPNQGPEMQWNSFDEYKAATKRLYMTKEVQDPTFPRTNEDDKTWVEAIIYNMCNMEDVVDNQKTKTAWQNLLNGREERVEVVAWHLLHQTKKYHTLEGRLDPKNPDTMKSPKVFSFAEHMNYMLKQFKSTKTVCRSVCQFFHLNTFIDGPEAVMNRVISNRRVNDNKKLKYKLGAAAAMKVNELGVEMGDEEVTQLANASKKRGRNEAAAAKKSPESKSSPPRKARGTYQRPTVRKLFPTGRGRRSNATSQLDDYAGLLGARRVGRSPSPDASPSDIDTPCPKGRRNSTRKSAKAAAAKVRKVYAKEDKSDDDFDDDFFGDDLLDEELLDDDAEGEDELMDAALVQYGGINGEATGANTYGSGHHHGLNIAPLEVSTSGFNPDITDLFADGNSSHSANGLSNDMNVSRVSDPFTLGYQGYEPNPKYETSSDTQMPRLDTNLDPAKPLLEAGWTYLGCQQDSPTAKTVESYGDFGAGDATFDHLGGQIDHVYSSQPSTATDEHFPLHGLESQPWSAITDHFPADTDTSYNGQSWPFTGPELDLAGFKALFGENSAGCDFTGIADPSENPSDDVFN